VVRDMASPLVTSAFSLVFGVLFLYLFLFPTLNRQIRQRNSRRGIILFMGSGVAAGVGVTSMYAGLKWAPVVVVSPVTAINPLFAIGLSYFFLKHMERITWRILLGALLVVGGVVLITLSQV
ncbi:MAG: DMT family transporter, partial [Dehalococcoidia bacterium]|nr:DMT family transporter [Dehalococcoidia bacterium]